MVSAEDVPIRIIVTGDSAGGNLSCIVTLRVRMAAPPAHIMTSTFRTGDRRRPAIADRVALNVPRCKPFHINVARAHPVQQRPGVEFPVDQSGARQLHGLEH